MFKTSMELVESMLVSDSDEDEEHEENLSIMTMIDELFRVC
jgi:hypothetical protein